MNKAKMQAEADLLRFMRKPQFADLHVVGDSVIFLDWENLRLRILGLLQEQFAKSWPADVMQDLERELLPILKLAITNRAEGNRPVCDVVSYSENDEGGCARCGGYLQWVRHSRPENSLPLVEILCASCDPPPEGTNVLDHELIARQMQRLQAEADRTISGASRFRRATIRVAEVGPSKPRILSAVLCPLPGPAWTLSESLAATPISGPPN